MRREYYLSREARSGLRSLCLWRPASAEPPLELGRLPKLMMEAMSSPAWVNCSLALAMSQ